MPDAQILKEILNINSVSGDEAQISSFIIEYVLKRKEHWKVAPKLFFGENFHDNVVLVFGQPRTAAFAHLDTTGFTARYENQLVPVGGPEISEGDRLQGEDPLGKIRCKAAIKSGNIYHDFPRLIQRGTCLSYEQNIKIDDGFIQAAYLDNRIGMYNLLKLCETISDGILVFSTYEEHGGGSMPLLIKFLFENWGIRQALISDVTWITDGIHFNNGAVISLRDSFIPRKIFLDKIIHLAELSGVPYQLEVEAHGGSDGREIQLSPYPIDWCFIGVGEENPHTPREKVSLYDLESMEKLYQNLFRNL
ncbi:MAG: aminopeptidase [Cyclobacteriaceae bacterium]